jgi:sterol desaturase/sphingolipid hydroxylase (fatty acid hydroxylase superfamily)
VFDHTHRSGVECHVCGLVSVLGFLGSCWAIAAHDGRSEYDLNNHYDHHCKGRGRFMYFNLGYVTPFWDQWCGTRWHEVLSISPTTQSLSQASYC